MAVSPTDFYAYAQATGTPVPRDKQEQAKLVPAVHQWKKSRLKAPEEENNTVDTVGKVALGAGLVTLGAELGRQALRRRSGRQVGGQIGRQPPKQQPPYDEYRPSPEYTQDVGTVGGLQKELTARASQTPSRTKRVIQDIRRQEQDTGIDIKTRGSRYAGVGDPEGFVPGQGEQGKFKYNDPGQSEAVKQYQRDVATGRIKQNPETGLMERVNPDLPENIFPVPTSQGEYVTKSEVQNRIADSVLEPKPKANFIESYLGDLRARTAAEPVVQTETAITPRGYIEGTGAIEPATQYTSAIGPNQITNPVPVLPTKKADITDEILNKYVDNDLAYQDEVNWLREQEALHGPKTLVERQNTSIPSVSQQSVEAVDTGLDQVEQQVDRLVQRDTDSIAFGKEAVEREVAAELVGENLQRVYGPLSREGQALEFADQARDEMIRRRADAEAAGFHPGSSRLEASLAMPVTGSKSVRLAEPSDLQQAPLARKTVLNIGPNAEIDQAVSGTTIRGASRSLQESWSDPYQTRVVSSPTWIDRRLGVGSEAEQKRFTSLPNAPLERGSDIQGTTQFAPNLSGVRDQPIAIPNPNGEGFIAVRGTPIQTEALPLGNRAPRSPVRPLIKPEIERIDPYALKSQGGGPGTGVYGIGQDYVGGAVSKQTGEYSAAATQKPTYVPSWLEQRENPRTPFTNVSDEGLLIAKKTATKPQAVKIQTELNRRGSARKSVTAAEEIRNIYQRERPEEREQKAQDFLDKLKRDLM